MASYAFYPSTSVYDKTIDFDKIKNSEMIDWDPKTKMYGGGLFVPAKHIYDGTVDFSRIPGATPTTPSISI